MAKRWWTAEEVGEEYRYSAVAIRKMARDRIIPSHRFVANGRLLFDPDEIAAALQRVDANMNGAQEPAAV